ncbi:hypothetical protein B0H21DRAFT_887998 [Amylocystis lapponica]|nr:hypothetical protein B0H21DRAFT_887998 [Amylocystis lapponica]
MRRLAAVFAPRRSDRSDAASSAADDRSAPEQGPLQTLSKKPSSARFFRSLSRKAQPPAAPIVVYELAQPSSSSSSSAGPSTPDDDRGSFVRSHDQKHWSPWPADHTVPAKPVLVPVQARSVLHQHAQASNHSVRSPTHPIRSPPQGPDSDPEEDDDDSDASSDANHDAPPSSLPKAVVPQVVRAPANVPRQSASRLGTIPAHARALTANSIHAAFSPPPLLHVPNAPLFPRSCNPSRLLPLQDTLLSHMFKTHLLRRLEHGLTPSEERSLAALSRRPPPPPLTPMAPSLTLDDTAVADAKRVSKHGEGLRRWAERPCFEDRMVLYVPAETSAGGAERSAATGIVSVHVSGTGFGVAALEISETLELLSGLYDPDAEAQPEQQEAPWAPIFELTPPLSLSPSTLSPASSGPPTPSIPTPTAAATSPAPAGTRSPPPTASPSPSSPRSQPYKAMPSPLRMEHGSPVTASSFPVMSPRTSSAKPAPFVPVSPQPQPSSPKPAVRFAEPVLQNEQQRRDNIPLGYVMRIKQQRAEKARFLEAERARRAQEEERQKRDEEVRRKQEEVRKQEEERRVRRAQDEERRQRAYAEEVSRARTRRESMRFEPEWERERDKKANVTTDRYARAAYDSLAPPTPRRQASEPGPRDGSPASRTSSARPPSSTSGSGRGSPVGYVQQSASRSSSTPDVRLRSGSRRGSFVSDGGHRTSSAPTSPQWTGGPNGGPRMSMNMGLLNVPQMPMMVPVPVAVPVPMPMQMQMQYGMGGMGMMGMDAPLVPPTPPFVMQQFGYRSPSQERGQSQGQRTRAHSSSPAPQQSQSQQQHRDSQPRAHSYSPTHARPPRNPLSPPPSAHRPSHALSSPSSYSQSHLPAPLRTPREHGHQRRSSADVDMHRMSHASAQDRDRDREDRRSTKSGPAPSRPLPRHHSSAPPPATPPVVVREPRSSWAVPQEGFQILSRPSQGRRKTMVS